MALYFANCGRWKDVERFKDRRDIYRITICVLNNDISSNEQHRTEHMFEERRDTSWDKEKRKKIFISPPRNTNNPPF